MPGASATVGHLYAIRWETINREDVNVLEAELAALRKRTGRPVLYLAVQDQNYREPDSVVRKLLFARFPMIMEHCKMDYILITANGVMASLQRSVMKTAVTAANLARMPHVHKVAVIHHIDELLAREAADLPASPEEVVRQLRAKGVLD